jgi:hypothetical protein
LYSVRPAATATRRVALRGAVATHHPGPPGKRGYGFGSLLWDALCVQPTNASTPFFSDSTPSHVPQRPSCSSCPLYFSRHDVDPSTTRTPTQIRHQVVYSVSPSVPVRVRVVSLQPHHHQCHSCDRGTWLVPDQIPRYNMHRTPCRVAAVSPRAQGFCSPRYCGARTRRGPCSAAHRRTVASFVALIAPLAVGKPRPLVSAVPSCHLFGLC